MGKTKWVSFCLPVRTIGLERAKVKVGLMNLVYNMRRLVQLEVIKEKARRARLAAGLGTGVPAMA